MQGSGGPTVCYMEVLTLESPTARGHSGWAQGIHINCK